jgi:ubiquinol-cytochrome c reductase cytochrome b subunit
MSPAARAREAAAVASLVCLLLLVTSGWALMAGYVPSDREAFDSVLYLQGATGLSVPLRSLHVHLASALVVGGALFLVASYLAGTPPLERRVWWAALALYGLVLAFCFTGFLLPMDQNAYWGTIVRLGIVETVPALGSPVADLLRGGPALNASSLTRFHTLHASVLPFLTLLPLGILLSPLRASEPARRRRWLAMALAMVGAAYLAAALVPAPLEPRAAPADVSYVPRPEWYFLWLFQIGKYVEAMPWIRSLVLPAILLGALAALPQLRLPAPDRRVLLVLGLAVGWSALTGLAIYEDRGLPARPSHEEALAARVEWIYREECSGCHGVSGKGDGSRARVFGLDVPDFDGADFWQDATDDTMRNGIRNGKGKDMPAFGRKLAAEEIDALVLWINSRFNPRS